jgi:hypothetical protein
MTPSLPLKQASIMAAGDALTCIVAPSGTAVMRAATAARSHLFLVETEVFRDRGCGAKGGMFHLIRLWYRRFVRNQ